MRLITSDQLHNAATATPRAVSSCKALPVSEDSARSECLRTCSSRPTKTTVGVYTRKWSRVRAMQHLAIYPVNFCFYALYSTQPGQIVS
jgi:hypothetical protein